MRYNTVMPDPAPKPKSLETLAIVWLIAALLGDELIGVAIIGLESDALLMSLTQLWWWIYQAVLLVVFGSVRMSLKKFEKSNDRL